MLPIKKKLAYTSLVVERQEQIYNQRLEELQLLKNKLYEAKEQLVY